MVWGRTGQIKALAAQLTASEFRNGRNIIVVQQNVPIETAVVLLGQAQ